MPGWQGSDRKQRLPANWPELRRYVLERDDYQCRLRYEGCLGHATDADHIHRGDDHSPAALQAACRVCHARKSAGEGAAARWAQRETRPREQHPGLL